MTSTIDAALYCQDSLPNCPLPLLQRLVVEASRQFAIDTKIFKMWIPPVALINGVSDYDLTARLPVDTVIFDLIHVRINGSDILAYSEEATTRAIDQQPYNPGCMPLGGGWSNLTYNRQNFNTVTIVQTGPQALSNIAGALLTVQLMAIPTMDAKCIDDKIWVPWFEPISDYVKWKAMTRPGEKFSDPAMGEYHHQEWLRRKGQAQVMIQTGNVTPRHRTVPDGFT